MNFTMHKPIRMVSLIPIAALCLASISSQAQTPMPMEGSASAPKAGMQSGMMASSDMKQSMKAGMDGMQQMQSSGDTDKDFAMMMKMHHQQALDMAQMELSHGKSAELKTMARKIVSGQTKEIAEFDRWLAKQK